MKLPDEISVRILQTLDMPDLNKFTQSRYTRKLSAIRRQMKRLAADFAANTHSETDYLDAYTVYNFPMNMMKTATVIEGIMTRYRDFASGKTRLSVLDIGCGDGAGLFGVYYALKDSIRIREFNMTGMDSSKKMLARARSMAGWLRKHDPRIGVHLLRHKFHEDLRFVSKKRYDIILAVNSLAEVIQETTIPDRFVISLLDHLISDGFLLIIEPALKRFSRRLMRLRDRLLLRREVQVLLPCLHDSPCALLQVGRRREWCHQSVSWSPPDFLKVINQGLNREIDLLKFSHLVIGKKTACRVKPNGYLVISQLLKEKGKTRCFLCTPRGRVELVRLNRLKSKYNFRFEELRKGNIVALENIDAKRTDCWQMTAQTTLKIVE